MSKYLVEIVIDIVGFEQDPDEITGLLGVSPTTVSRKGVNGNKTKTPVRNAWSIYSEPPLDWPEARHSVATHWKELCRRISGKEELFKILSKNSRIELTVIVRSEDRYPLVRLPKELIRYAHAADFSRIDIDIYQ
jgi:hypothetical protein